MNGFFFHSNCFKLSSCVLCLSISSQHSVYCYIYRGDEQYWFPLIKAVWKVPTNQMQHLVKDILGNNSLKRMWNWKVITIGLLE